ncbi:MAG: hypothetical protein PHG67_11540 [Bacteroidales bacterium]|nr:hypothetical protein [Bacteroidales bacterium]
MDNACGLKARGMAMARIALRQVYLATDRLFSACSEHRSPGKLAPASELKLRVYWFDVVADYTE